MAIKISGSTIIDDSRNIVNAGVVTATSFSGDGSSLTGVGIGTDGSVNTTGIGTFSTVVATNDLDIPSGTTAERPTPTAGSFRYNSEYGVLELYTGTEWKGIYLSTSIVPNPADTGVFGGGSPSPSILTYTIDYITIASVGNATDFGDLNVEIGDLAACSSSTRGVFGGGSGPATPFPVQNVIDYITIATTGNATNFGDLSVARQELSSCSSSTRGVFGGGLVTPASNNTIDYITIASEGNALDFGDLTVARNDSASCSSSTRGVFGGGIVSVPLSGQNVIDYITIATTGNATDFGDLSVTRGELAACSNNTRGVFGGGLVTPLTRQNVIDYITIATTGNATDFGDLSVTRSKLSACSSSTRGVFGGGFAPSVPTIVNTIDYITIATTGDATDFGDLTVARSSLTACSSAHGGLS